jgi:hypothetical protein
MLIEAWNADAPPKVFVSYSHDDEKHKQWVLKLATKLRQNGVDATLDQWDCNPPIDVTRWMEDNLRRASHVIIICTDKYLAKSNMSVGGVGYERMIITAEISKDLDTTKFIPVVRRQAAQRAMPDFMGARIYIDFTDDLQFDDSLMRLLRVIHNAPENAKPAIGPNPFSGLTRPPI